MPRRASGRSWGLGSAAPRGRRLGKVVGRRFENALAIEQQTGAKLRKLDVTDRNALVVSGTQEAVQAACDLVAQIVQTVDRRGGGDGGVERPRRQ